MLIDEGLELLTEEQALDLLHQADFGRVGLTMGAIPVILPVNYRMIDGAIVFRTSAGLEAERGGSRRRRRVRGRRARPGGLEPAADGRRAAIIRIEPAFVSGRRIVHDA